MSFVVDEASRQCIKFYVEWGKFLRGTRTMVRSLRKIHHGVCIEHQKLSNKAPDVKQAIIERHKTAFQKVIKMLDIYLDNFFTQEMQFRDFVKHQSKYCKIRLAKVQDRHNEVCVQRDVILNCVESIIRSQLKVLARNFETETSVIEGNHIFELIDGYNKALVKLKRGPEYKEEDLDTDCVDLRAVFINNITPDAVLPPLRNLKQLTASKILQSIGRERSSEVTQCIADTLMSNIDTPKENGIQLPWKGLTYDGVFGYIQMDIFEQAIAKEEDENKLNQRKLDMALMMEFGEDFPGTDYLPANDSDPSVQPVSCSQMNALIRTNTEFFNQLLKKFITTSGVIGKDFVILGFKGNMVSILN